MSQSKKKITKQFPIVGIGASAGGLEAFRQLLERLPTDTGMAFVLVQHLDPTHESKLTELLARSTKLPVAEVSNGMPILSNHIHVIPPNTCLSITDGKLKLAPRRTRPGYNLPIDFFLQSLAQASGPLAIGVILSGTASDGAEGIKAIKAAGGITFAQDEQSAKYAGMPHTAIATGCVDFILPPAAIAKELAFLSRHPFVRRSTVAGPGPLAREPESTLQRIFHLIRGASGVDFAHYKPTTIGRRIQRRMVVHKLQKLEDYRRYLEDHPPEITLLYEDLLIGVTSFFRDPAVFHALKRKVFPQILRHHGDARPIRLWVPGCATGAEAYSLAILMLEFLGEKKLDLPMQIFATDISEQSLERARAGIYPATIESVVSAARRRRFFVKTTGGYQISKNIRELCVFARQNLVKDPPFSNLDLITCRNVLIYLEPLLQKQVLPVLHYALKPTGFLLLGGSETISSFENLFAVVDRRQKIFSRKPATTRPFLDFGYGEMPPDKLEPAPKTGKLVWDTPDFRKEADRLLLGRFAPASVVVNDDLEIVQFRGRTGRYLEPASGTASLNLLKMAREGLVMELRTAIQAARRKGVIVRKTGMRVKTNGEDHEFTLEVAPLKIAGSAERQFLILFEEGAGATVTDPPPAAAPLPKAVADRQIVRLEQELAATKEYMRSVVEDLEGANEELKAASEEIQSSNEELQSTNEELETAKEELQSTNEELTTLNEELQSRNLELSQSNNDLINLLTSVNIPILMLGADLRVRRVTPVAERLFSLHPTDIGRPLAALRLPVEAGKLEKMVADSIADLAVKQREIQDHDGHWYSLWVHPYRTLDNKIDGAVLAFLDVHALKQSLVATQQAQVYAEAIIETMREPLLVLDAELKVRSANTAFCKLFQESKASVERQFLYELGNGQWNIPPLRDLLQSLLQDGASCENYQVAHDFPKIGQRIMLLNARRLNFADGGLILLAMEDITERLQLQKAVLDISEQERERMGRDLHDGLGQQLAGIAFLAETLCSGLQAKAPAHAGAAQKIVKHLKQAVEITHDLARSLFPVQLKTEGLVPALRALAANVEDLFTVTCHVDCDTPVTIKDENVARHLYRIAQEAVYNAVKHSKGKVVRVTLEAKDGTILLTVKDDGRGFKRAVVEAADMGMHIMTYRAQLIGATLEINSQPGQGTTVACTFKKHAP